MPKAEVIARKQEEVATLAEKLKSSVSGVVVNYQGITVEDDTKLRTELRKAEIDYKVYKNSISSRACESAGFSDLTPSFTGMTAIAISYKDEIAPAKILKEYATKIESFNILAGYVNGEVIDKQGVIALADIPSKEALLCKVMGSMLSSLYGLAYGLQAIIDKSGETVPAAE